MSASACKERSERMLIVISRMLFADGHRDHLRWTRAGNSEMLARLRIYMLDAGYPVEIVQHTDLMV